MLRLPPLNALRAFEATARNLSFSRAAEELFVTQGAVSRHILKLEDFLGIKLFVRLHKRVELTIRDAVPLPRPLVSAAVGPVQAMLDGVLDRIDHGGRYGQPDRVVPGSLGSWALDEGVAG